MVERGKFLLKNYGRFEEAFSHGENATLFHEDGRDFIDFGSGIGVSSVGHGSKELSKAIFNQVSNLIHVSNLYNIKQQEDLAERLSFLTGFEIFSFFANSGAEANEAGIKLARKYGSKDGRYKIISLKNGFHGRTYGSLSATAQPSLHKGFEPMLDGFVYVDELSDIEKNIDDKTVAVMIELVRGEGGVNALPKDEVQKLDKLLKSKEILLFVDEVQSGIFRTGQFLASNIYEIEPDIITLAKGLAGGVPIGAMMTKLKDGFSAGDHGSTFGGNPLSTASALKVLEILEEEFSTERLKSRIEIFDKKLEELLNIFPNIFREKSGLGLMRGLVVNPEIDVAKIVKAGNRERVLTIKSGNNTLRFLPPLTISENEISEGFDRLKKAIAEFN